MVDEIDLQVVAGHGGAGLVSFRREKYVPKGGPDGGDGGRGGDVVFQAVDDISALGRLLRFKKIKADHGQPGGPSRKHGRDGEDLVVKLPVGSIVYETEATGNKRRIVAEFLTSGQTHIIAKGGQGGLGNWHFATATRQAPRFAQPGRPGQIRQLFIELQLIAEVGVVGLPNAGKSSFLARVSSAKPKIADYPFTTLEPNLGVVQYKGEVFVMADIPGLIAGAHQGKGLGDRFLRHIKRTRVLIYLIDATGEDWLENLQVVQTELRSFDQSLSRKSHLVVLTKADIAREKPLPRGWFLTSAITGAGINDVLDHVIFLLSKRPNDD